MKVIITGTVTLNGGDAAILIAEEELLREALGSSLQVVVFDTHPIAAHRHYPDYDFRLRLAKNGQRGPEGIPVLGGLIRRLNSRRYAFGVAVWLSRGRRMSRLLLSRREIRDLLEYQTADLVAFTGGTYLVENYSLEWLSLELKVISRLGKRYVLLPQSMGPFSGRLNRLKMAECLSGAELVLLRDARSFSHATALAPANPRMLVVPDAAFGLRPREQLEGHSLDVRDPMALRVAVSVREWPYFTTKPNSAGMADFMEAIASAVVALVRHWGADVVFLSTCQGVSDYWTDDSRVASAIWSAVPDDVQAGATVDSCFHDPRDLAGMLGRFDFTIATRLHAGILSLLAGTPVLPISYEFKAREVFDELGFAEWVTDIESIQPGRFAALVENFVSQLPKLRVQVNEELPRQKAKLRQCVSPLSAAVRRERHDARASGRD
jgi:colanic acid/amylovoran biosynthesis protein